MARVGVFVCHCGLNIAGTVDVPQVVEALRGERDVVLSTDYKYMCSDPGQGLIRQAIHEHDLDGVVVAACSPAMHEATFRKTAGAAGLNPYRVEIANVREQVAWPHQDRPEAATLKAVEAVRAIVEKVRQDRPLVPLTLPVVKRALVVGGGIAGLTAALDIAEAGYPVLLVERSERLGGRMAQLSRLYLNFDGSADLLGERIDAVRRHPLIEVRTGAEVTEFGGYVGNFAVEVGDQGPGSPVARRDSIGAVVLATGFDLYAPSNLPEYGGGRHADVVDGLQFEAMLAAGEIRRPSDGEVPREVVWVQCAGSRDPQLHRSYCSKVCCMYVAKQATAYRRAVPEGRAYVFYIDIRSQGRGYDEFVQHAMENEGVVYLRGKVSRIVRRAGRHDDRQDDRHDGGLEVWGADTLSGRSVRVPADLVVLALAAVPSAGSDALARLLRVAGDESGFFAEAHPKLRPVESLTAGVFLAGAAQFPKDIPETVAQASGAAAKVLQLFARRELVAEPTIAAVRERLCVGCGLCVPACPYNARELHAWKKLATVNAALCQGCGACAVVCRNKASVVRNMAAGQVLAMMDALL